MTSEQFDEWLRRLRSGEYRQTRGSFVRYTYLFPRPPSYCAVGLLRDITQSIPGLHIKLFAEVVTWNDKDKLTFAQIADKLEERREEFVKENNTHE